MREIILDTETTGLSPKQGHRLIEIGCLEMINKRVTNKIFHSYLNPECVVPTTSSEITGLTYDFLKDKPLFSEVAESFMNFIGEDKLVIHNAPFDLSFINTELTTIGMPILNSTRVLDTLVMAKKKFPGSPASLDALCKRFNINLTKRDKHGAMIDVELLAKVYIELLGGRQINLSIKKHQEATPKSSENESFFPRRYFKLNEKTIELHKLYMNDFEKNIWY